MTEPQARPPIAELPFQVRPRRSEGARSFILRLAEANCLPPAYLRKVLCEPPLHRGSPTWPRIAAAAGRNSAELQSILETRYCTECGTAMPPVSTYGVRRKTCSRICRQQRYLNGPARKNWRTAACRVCGGSMMFRLGQRRYMCSSKCRQIAFQFRQLGKRLPMPANFESMTHAAVEHDRAALCPGCERPLPQPAGGLETCSERCEAKITLWAAAPAPPVTHCGRCHKRTVPRSDGKRRRFCSTGCRAKRKRPPAQKPQRQEPPRIALRARPTAEAALASWACRGCHTGFRPQAAANPWCSHACLDQGIADSMSQRQCACCGTSLADRTENNSRRWCSRYCRQKAVYWRQEIRNRTGASSDHSRVRTLVKAPETVQPVTTAVPAAAAWACRGCQTSFHPLAAANPWCSHACLDQRIAEAQQQNHCAGCNASLAERPYVSSRRWCSRYCRQKAVYWRQEIRDRDEDLPNFSETNGQVSQVH